jgi:alpha-glucosidase
MLSLYREALQIRRVEPGLGDGSLRWLEAPEGVLAFARSGRFAFVLNLSGASVELPPHDDVLLRSEPLEDGMLPSDTAVWLRSG